jgi:hypothetical protein
VEETTQSQSEGGAEGFCTKPGTMQLIRDTSPVGEAVVDALLFSKTSKGHTWLVATQKKLYSVLDDAERRKTRELVQSALPLEDAEPISLRSPDKPTSGASQARPLAKLAIGECGWDLSDGGVAAIFCL